MSEEIDYEQQEQEIDEFGSEPEGSTEISTENPDQENLQPEEGNISQQIFKQTDLGLIAGKRGSGKTNLLLFLISYFTKMKVNLVIIDPVHDLKANLRKLYKKDDPRVIHVPYGNRQQFDSVLTQLIQKGWKGIIIVDEADQFFPNRKQLTDIENHFIQIGRHHGIGGIFVTRRLAKLHTDLPSQANKIFLFKHWQRADLDYLRESNLGDYAFLLRSLDKYHFMYLNTDQEECIICEPVEQMK